MISIGIDNGNYNTKSSEGTIFPSGYLVSSVPPIGADNCLFYDGKYYDIGAKRAAVQYDLSLIHICMRYTLQFKKFII